jgi:hypothetical protein
MVASSAHERVRTRLTVTSLFHTSVTQTHGCVRRAIIVWGEGWDLQMEEARVNTHIRYGCMGDGCATSGWV